MTGESYRKGEKWNKGQRKLLRELESLMKRKDEGERWRGHNDAAYIALEVSPTKSEEEQLTSCRGRRERAESSLDQAATVAEHLHGGRRRGLC